MKKAIGIIILGLLVLIQQTLFFDKTIVDKPKLNKILNKLIKGDFYYCSYAYVSKVRSNTRLKNSGKVLKKGNVYNPEAMKYINLIKSGKYYGLLFSSGNRRNYLNAIYVKTSGNRAGLGVSYQSLGSDYDKDQADSTFILKFTGKVLAINTGYIDIFDTYKCELEKLPKDMKISILKRFNRYRSY